MSMPHSPTSPLPTLSSTFPIDKSPPQSVSSPNTIPIQQTRKSKKAENDAAVRAAKLQIRENVREDWAWPSLELDLPIPRSASIDTQWRKRESDSSLSPSPSPEAHEGSPPTDPYKFDSPDSLFDVKSSKKRKRQHALQEELEYNNGLSTFMRRRDAWTGAISVPQTPPEPILEDESSDSALAGSSSDDSGLSSPSTSTSNVSTTCNVGSLALEPKHTFSTSRAAEQPLDKLGPPMLVPLPPPLLPHTNPIRAAISPTTYPSIYSKIVVQGLSPTIPVNLKDVVCAMVDGWKRDGEWPPRDSGGRVYQGKDAAGTGNAASLGDGMGKALAKRGVGRMKRALGLDKEGGTGDG